MSQWAITVDGDLALPLRGQGASAIVRDVATCAKIKITAELQFVQGEWILDTSLGFPWVPIWRTKNPDINAIKLQLQKKVLSIAPVVGVDDLFATYDRAKRDTRYGYRARLSNGQTVTGP